MAIDTENKRRRSIVGCTALELVSISMGSVSFRMAYLSAMKRQRTRIFCENRRRHSWTGVHLYTALFEPSRNPVAIAAESRIVRRASTVNGGRPLASLHLYALTTPLYSPVDGCQGRRDRAVPAT